MNVAEVPSEVAERVRIIAWLVGLAEHIRSGVADDPLVTRAEALAARATGIATLAHAIEQIGLGAHDGIQVEVDEAGRVYAVMRPARVH